MLSSLTINFDTWRDLIIFDPSHPPLDIVQLKPRFLDPTPPLSKRRNAKPLRCPKLTKTNSESQCRGQNRFPEKSHGKHLPTKKKNTWQNCLQGPTVGQSLAIHVLPSGHEPRLRTLQESLEGLSAALLVGDHLAVRLWSKGDTLTRSNKI